MAGITAAMVLAADPALAAGTVIGGVSTLLGLLAALWGVMVARGSSLEADGAAVWLVGGAVVGTAGWAGRRLLMERAFAGWRHALDRCAAVLRSADAHAARSAERVHGALDGMAAPRGADGRARATMERRVSASVNASASSSTTASTARLIHRCPDTTWPEALDRDQVLADARRCFVALQAAWDAHDIARLAELTTPDMLADVQALLEARGHVPNHTDVLTLDAEVICIEAIGTAWCASLEFSGFIREKADAPALPFRELWMLAAPKDGPVRWRLARQQALL